eukprot:340945-Pyramimonas_sp.AAC.1
MREGWERMLEGRVRMLEGRVRMSEGVQCSIWKDSHCCAVPLTDPLCCTTVRCGHGARLAAVLCH